MGLIQKLRSVLWPFFKVKSEIIVLKKLNITIED